MEPVLATAFVCLAVILIWGGNIFTRHKERLLLIERGVKAEDIRPLYERHLGKSNPYSALKWGMVFTAIGLAALISVWLTEVFDLPDGIIPALISLFGGLGLIGFYLIAGRKPA
jgi:hypothetical protein